MKGAEADLRIYRELKRSTALRSALLVTAAGLAVAVRAPLGAFALLVGGGCGLLNIWLTMRSGERLVAHRSVGAFVFSSFLRLGVFGILPVGLALHGPWWTLAMYFAGFFTPLVLYMFSVQRAFERK